MWRQYVDFPHGLNPFVGVLETCRRDIARIRHEQADTTVLRFRTTDQVDDGRLVSDIDLGRRSAN